MQRFFGTYQAVLDTKGRVAVPARLRHAVEDRDQGRFVLTVTPERCLVLYTYDVFERIAEEIEERARNALGSMQARALERELFSNAEELQPDRQGRILIPERLRTRIGLTKNIVFAGVRNRIEIWDAQEWEADQITRQESFGAYAHEVLSPTTQPSATQTISPPGRNA